MPLASIQPPPTFDAILTGHFKQISGYAVQRPHGSNDYLMIYTAGGQGRFEHHPTADHHTLTSAGTLALLPPGLFHQYGTAPSPARPTARSRWELIWTHFHPRPGWTELLRWPGPTPGLGLTHLPAAAAKDVEQILLRMHRYASGPHARGCDLALSCVEQVLLHASAIHQSHGAPALHPRIAEAMRLLAERPQDPFHLPALAEKVSLSPSRLSHLFREQAHMTPLEFHDRQRIDLARRLLRATSMSIKEISAACGYSSPFYFSRRFKQSTGKSPALWRS